MLSKGSHIKKNKYMLPMVLSSAAIVYILTVRRLGFGIPCIFHRITGFKCPGCGITGLLVSLSRLDFETAFVSNRFIFATSPFLLVELLFTVVLKFKKKRMPMWNEKLLLAYAVLLIGWGILRNIYTW